MEDLSKGFAPRFPALLTEQVAEFLAKALIDGQIRQGERLNENELGRRFGISRSPIRESFRVLERDGFLVRVPRKGTFVREITERDIEEIFPVRAHLEGLAARMAASNVDAKQLEELKGSLGKMSEAVKENNPGKYRKHHFDFHNEFIRASKNAVLIGILERLRRQSIWYMFTDFFSREACELRSAIPVHRKIVELLEKQRAEELDTLVKDHVLSTYRRFLEFLKTKEDLKTGTVNEAKLVQPGKGAKQWVKRF